MIHPMRRSGAEIAVERASWVAAAEYLRPPPVWVYPFARMVFSTYCGLFHRVELRGVRRPPRRGPLIVISNHPTYMDPAFVGLGLRRHVVWMAWDEIFSWPIAGGLTRAFRALPVDLEKPRPSMMRAARAVLDHGLALGVFPEGGRTTGLGVDRFKPGGARLAVATGVPVLPVSISGAQRVWPKSAAFPGVGGRVTVTYHDVLDPSAIESGRPPRAREEALTAKLQRTIASAV